MPKHTGMVSASRTVTLEIQDWARLEEIIQIREMKNLQSVLTYVIRAQHATARANQVMNEKKELANV